MELRGKTPKRRSNPLETTDYHKHKDNLREDFGQRCGYCNDHDYFRLTDYQIDHFVPKVQLRTIKEADYSNLVYSCKSCNRAKWDKWPTGNEKVANDGKIGFVDPCDAEYDKQFSRNVRGEIVAVTQLGVWMWKALNFGNPSHAVVWKLEQLRRTIDELQVIADAQQTNSSVSMRLNILNKQYREYFDELRGGAPVF